MIQKININELNKLLNAESIVQVDIAFEKSTVNFKMGIGGILNIYYEDGK